MIVHHIIYVYVYPWARKYNRASKNCILLISNQSQDVYGGYPALSSFLKNHEDFPLLECTKRLQWLLFFLQADTKIAEARGGEGKPRWSKMFDTVDRSVMWSRIAMMRMMRMMTMTTMMVMVIGIVMIVLVVNLRCRRKQKPKAKQRQRPRVSLRMRRGELVQMRGMIENLWLQVSSSNVYRSLQLACVNPHEFQGFWRFGGLPICAHLCE